MGVATFDCIPAAADPSTRPDQRDSDNRQESRPPRSRTRNRRRRAQNPKRHACLTEIVDGALNSSLSATRGVNAVDKRFKWRVLGVYHAPQKSTDGDVETDKSVDSEPACPLDTGLARRDANPKPAPIGFYASLFGDTLLMMDVLFAIQMRVAAVTRTGVHATVVVGGSTGMRLQACSGRRDDSTFPIGDIDVDVYASDESGRSAIIAALDAACTDIVLDREFEKKCSDRLPGTLQLDGCRTNSRLYTTNADGAAVSVDVPRLAETTHRLRHAPVFATRNDTLNGFTLHRIRLALKVRPDSHLSGENVPRSIPLVDVKTHVGTPPKTVERRVAGLRVRVPTAQEAAAELRRLLEREYEGVDEGKDDVRRRQLAAVETSGGMRRHGRLRRGGSQ